MYSFRTRVGVFAIVERDGRWYIIFHGDDLGNYVTPAQAADGLAGGHTHSPLSGVDTATLGIPADLLEWDRK